MDTTLFGDLAHANGVYSMKFYLAGRYDDIEFLRSVARVIHRRGHSVTSRWLFGTTPHLSSTQEFNLAAEMDLSDIRAADAFVLYSHARQPLPTRQGHSVELGYALARTPKMAVVIVGQRTDNVFHYADDVAYVRTWDDFYMQYIVSNAECSSCRGT